MAKKTIADMAIPLELGNTLDYIYNEACKCAEKEHLPQPKKHEIYRLLLSLGAESWKKLRIQPQNPKK